MVQDPSVAAQPSAAPSGPAGGQPGTVTAGQVAGREQLPGPGGDGAGGPRGPCPHPAPPAGSGSARGAPTRCAPGGTGWCWPWSPCWRSPRARAGRKPPPSAGSPHDCTPPAAVLEPAAPRRLSLLRQGMACLGPCWPRGAGGPGFGCGPGTLTRSLASDTQRLLPTPRPVNPQRRHPGRSVPATYPPYPKPHIYLSRASPPLKAMWMRPKMAPMASPRIHTCATSPSLPSSIWWTYQLRTAAISRCDPGPTSSPTISFGAGNMKC